MKFQISNFKYQSSKAAFLTVLILLTANSFLPALVYAMELRDVVVAKALIKRGQVINQEDVAVEARAVSRALTDSIQDPAAVVGMAAKIYIRAGVIIKKSMLASKMIVKRGEPVTIVAQTGSVVVTAMGQAMEDGSEGKVIKVLNMSSRKMITGKVVADSTVSIPF